MKTNGNTMEEVASAISLGQGYDNVLAMLSEDSETEKNLSGRTIAIDSSKIGTEREIMRDYFVQRMKRAERRAA